MGFQCVPQLIGLTREKTPKGKHRMPLEKAIEEAAEERYSKSETLDRDRSDLNRYDSIYGTNNGFEISRRMKNRADSYKSKVTDKNGVEHERKLRSDAVIGWALIINPPYEVTVNWDDDTYDRFNSDAWAYFEQLTVKQKDGTEVRMFTDDNTTFTAEHFDEGGDPSEHNGSINRHLHKFGFAWDENRDFNCGNLIDGKLFDKINHGDNSFASWMKKRGWDIDEPKPEGKGGKTVNENLAEQRKHLSTDNKRLKADNKRLKAERDELTDKGIKVLNHCKELKAENEALRNREPDIKTEVKTEVKTVIQYRDNPEQTEAIKKQTEAIKKLETALSSEKAKIEHISDFLKKTVEGSGFLPEGYTDDFEASEGDIRDLIEVSFIEAVKFYKAEKAKNRELTDKVSEYEAIEKKRAEEAEKAIKRLDSASSSERYKTNSLDF